MSIQKNRVCIKAFLNGNLGDDLFIYTLCTRYPSSKFIICGPGKYKKSFVKIGNLQYISTNPKIIMIFIKPINIIIGKLKKIFGLDDYNIETLSINRLFFNYLSRRSKYNVLISGSYFIEKKDALRTNKKKFKEDSKYYSLKPYIMGCNFGPFYTRDYLEHYQKMFSYATQVSLRDKASCSLFHSVTNIRYGADILFGLQMERKTREEKYAFISVLRPYKDKNVINIKEKEKVYIEFIIALIKQLITKYEKVICAGFCNDQGDGYIVDVICKNVQNEKVVAMKYPEYSMDKMVQSLAGASCVFASRYHAMILAIKYSIPVYAFAYSSKMVNVINDCPVKIPYKRIDSLNKSNVNEILSSIQQVDYNQDYLKKWINSYEEHFIELDGALKEGR